MNFDFGNWREKSKALADQAAESFRGQASGMTDQAVRSAVDQGLHFLSIAVDHVKQKEPPPPSLSIGVGMNLGLVDLQMQVHVPDHGTPEDVSVALKRTRHDEGRDDPGVRGGKGES